MSGTTRHRSQPLRVATTQPKSGSRVIDQFRDAVIALEADDPARAAQLLDKVLSVVPDNPDARCLRGVAANQLGDYGRAVRDLKRATRMFSIDAAEHRDAFNEYAMALKGSDDLPAAELLLREIVALHPDFGAAWHNLALVLQARDQLAEAIAAARRSVAAERDTNAGALLLLGKLLRTQGRLLSARGVLQRALAIEPDDVSINTTLGNTYFYLGEIDAALGCFRRTTEIYPDEPVFHSNYATMLTHCRRYEEARAEHERAFALDPTNPELVVRRAAMLLNTGFLRDGWESYDARLGAPPKSRRWTATPQWQGEPLDSETICVYREQGIGDEIMFASTYDDIIERSKHVIIECDPRLQGLFTRSFPRADVQPQTEEDATAHPDANIVVPAGSVLKYVRTNLSDFAGRASFLAADPESIDTWRQRLRADVGNGPIVGISWRSMIRTAERRLEYTRLDEWGPILRQAAGCSFVLLQYDQCEREVFEAERRFGIRIHRWRDLDLMNDFDNVGALMSNLDLVIAPRNAVTMLAGALGTPTLAIGNVGDWSECGTGQLPWFTSVECLNRAVDGDWLPVIAHASRRVEQLINGHAPLSSITLRKVTV